MLKIISICGLLIGLQCFLIFTFVYKFSKGDLELSSFEWNPGWSSTSNNKKVERQLIKINRTKDVLKKLESKRKALSNQLEGLIKNHTLAVKRQSKLLNELSDLKEGSTENLINEPSFQYEIIRRRVARNIRNYLNYLVQDVKTISYRYGISLVNETLFISNIREYKLAFWNYLERIPHVDGFEGWRKVEKEELSSIVQNRLQNLQNPENCSDSRILLCRHRNECGFSCNLDHLVCCLTVAYGTKRTLILQPKRYNYYKGGYEEVFQPLSYSCLNHSEENFLEWPAPPEERVIQLYTSYVNATIRPIYYPNAIPQDLSERLIKLHDLPYLFWIGQFSRYLLRPQGMIQNKVDDHINSLGFRRPIVGVHVRRTDKLLSEAQYHSLAEYFEKVDEYYDHLELFQKIDKRRVFLASDDPTVLVEARQNYSQYEIITNIEAAKEAQNLNTRYSLSSLEGILVDIQLLARSDYIVCTLTSEVCRVSYELMQSYHTDASRKIFSCDLQYFFTRQKDRYYEAILPHNPRDSIETDIRVGDRLIDRGTSFDTRGFILVYNERTNKTGYVPRLKVNEFFDITDFPEYAKINED